jgi:quercetin dioxygenase-like cupin family protein
MGRRVVGLVFVVLLAVLAFRTPTLTPSNIERNVVMKAEMTDMGPMDGYVIVAEIPPGGQSGRHSHPGHEYIYVLSGEPTLEFDRMPPTTLKPGIAFHVGPGVIHNGRNLSATQPVKLAIFSVIEKGRPTLVPASGK